MNRSIFNRTVIDDGWQMPEELLEEIEFRIVKAKEAAMREVMKKHAAHRGKWINEKVVREYQAKAMVWRALSDYQNVQKVREIAKELQQEYGLTELEAINILNERNVRDYLNKYYRIQNMIPQAVDSLLIIRDVKEQYQEICQFA